MFREFSYNGVKVTITGPHNVDELVGGNDRTTPVGEWYDIVADEVILGHFHTRKEQDGGLTVLDVICASDVLDHEDLERIANLVAAHGLV
jgi:hypothetical protein